MISTGVDIDRILHFVFMIKYSKFIDNIGSGNFTDTFRQNTDSFLEKVEGRGVLHPDTPPPPLGTPFTVSFTHGGDLQTIKYTMKPTKKSYLIHYDFKQFIK